jgi:exopolysaccharide biosynthesis WecB/TagA/CpsF family protein
MQSVWNEPLLATVHPVERLSSSLAREFHAHSSKSVTWLNHYSAPIVFANAASEIDTFDIVEVDGKLLQHILRYPHRTSADLVLPGLLPNLHGARVAVVGGRADTMDDRKAALQRLLAADSSVVLTADGYSGLPGLEDFADELAASQANVVIVGLGAGLQERYAAKAKQTFSHGGLALTCGGFLDQLLTPGYYPRWAYPLRLNWLVRLAREPRRLWRRYTFDAAAAITHGTDLRNHAASLASLR